MAYKKLRQLTISKQVGWEIKVKIIRMWRSINNVTDELISLDMILMDEQGETIRATIWSNLIESYESKIIEGSVYALSNFKVQEDSKYRPVKNTLKIVFMYNTNIKEVEGQSEELSNEEENVPKLMEIDKSTQGTEEEQMFYNRKTLLDITQMRHHSPIDKDFVFTTKATIDQLKENTAWWYMSCDGCNKMCNTIQNKYYCSRCNKNPETITARYWIRFQISDHTTTTTCTIFDDDAQRLLKINVTSLLDSLDGKSEDVPKLIQQLYGKTFIFQFKLNNENLTEGKPNYLVKRTFIPNDALELRYSNDQTEEEPMKNDSTGRLEDGDVENNTSSECIGAKQRKRKRKRVEDDSDKDCIEIDDPRKSNYKHQKRVEESIHAESGNNSKIDGSNEGKKKIKSKKFKKRKLTSKGTKKDEERCIYDAPEQHEHSNQEESIIQEEESTILDLQSMAEEPLDAGGSSNIIVDRSNNKKRKPKSQKTKRMKINNEANQKDIEKCIDALDEHQHSKKIGCEEEDINKSGSDDEYKEKDTVPVQKKDLPARCKSTRARRTPARYMT
ncbi:hypothetical protein EJB05_55839, partial [Eragrostis curvula]